jgi:formamidopyrimidine-DNA glycosylase
MPADTFTAGLHGRRIEGTARRAKFLQIGLDNGLTWVVHRRMSGNILHRPSGAPDEPFLRARFTLDDGAELRFIDLRKFGTMWLVDDPAPLFVDLGPEPLDAAFTVDVLRAILKKRSTPVKAVLLDQSAIAGIGNLYADEALHYAKIHPLRPASRLTKAEAERLHDGIVRALEQGLRNCGSSVGVVTDGEDVSLRDHVNLSGEPGSNQEYLVAYGREGRPCRACETLIERLKVGQRSAHYCPKCQPRPRLRKKKAATRRRG